MTRKVDFLRIFEFFRYFFRKFSIFAIFSILKGICSLKINIFCIFGGPRGAPIDWGALGTPNGYQSPWGPHGSPLGTHGNPFVADLAPLSPETMNWRIKSIWWVSNYSMHLSICCLTQQWQWKQGIFEIQPQALCCCTRKCLPFLKGPKKGYFYNFLQFFGILGFFKKSVFWLI